MTRIPASHPRDLPDTSSLVFVFCAGPVEGEPVNVPTTVIGQSVRALRRVVIERVEPEVDGGRFPIKRTIGEKGTVRADIYADGHDVLRSGAAVSASRMRVHGRKSPCGWSRMTGGKGVFKSRCLGGTLTRLWRGWMRFGTWSADLEKRAQAGQDIAVDVLVGAEIVRTAAGRASGGETRRD